MSSVPSNGPSGVSSEAHLSLSRDRMRDFLQSSVPQSKHGTPSRTPHPIGHSLMDAARVWFGSQPWVGAARLGTEAGRQALAPIAQRHPLALVGAAAAVGGLIAWLRPWRGILRPALVAGIGSQVASRLIARMPVERLLDGAFDMFSSASRSGSSSAPPSQRMH